MSVVFDIQGVQSRAHGERGIARYLVEQALALEELEPTPVWRYVLNPELPVPATVEPLTTSRRLTFSDRLDAAKGSVFHIGSPIESEVAVDLIWPPQARAMRMVVNLYDVIPELFPHVYLADELTRSRYRTRLNLVRKADRVLAISEATARDSVEHLGLRSEKVVVIGTGVSDRFRPTTDRRSALRAAAKRVQGLRPGYVLYTGGIDYRKNIDGLLTAYSELPRPLRANHQLVVVCRVHPEERERLNKQLAELGVDRDVLFPGFVPDETLLLLYQGTDLFVFPSLYEGFGLPLAEAIACGAPAIAGRSSSLIELVDDEVALFDPRDPRSIREAIERCLSSPDLLARLRTRRLDRRHSWGAVAERTAEAYAELQRTRSRRRRRNRRFAFVSPLPPHGSGVADESFRLLAALAGRCSVDVFFDERFGEVIAPKGTVAHPLSRFDRIEGARGGYDKVVFCLGNSEYHDGILKLLRRRSGIVIAHDVRLTGLYGWSARADGSWDFKETLDAMYGERLPAHLGLDDGISYEDADRYGVYMAREVISHSERYLVHSNHAAQLAMLEAPPGDEVKVAVVPYGVIAPTEFPERKLNHERPLVATFGIVSASKQVEKVVQAFAHVAANESAVTLAIVGEAPDKRYATSLAKLTDDLGIADRTVQSGRLSESEFLARISATSVSVQLRATSNGETSAVVARCLAGGVPTIVTDIGSARELPDDCAVKVDRDCSPEALATEICALLGDAVRRETLRNAGTAYAQNRSFERVAEHFYEAVVLERRQIEPYPALSAGRN